MKERAVALLAEIKRGIASLPHAQRCRGFQCAICDAICAAMGAAEELEELLEKIG